MKNTLQLRITEDFMKITQLIQYFQYSYDKNVVDYIMRWYFHEISKFIPLQFGLN